MVDKTDFADFSSRSQMQVSNIGRIEVRVNGIRQFCNDATESEVVSCGHNEDSDESEMPRESCTNHYFEKSAHNRCDFEYHSPEYDHDLDLLLADLRRIAASQPSKENRSVESRAPRFSTFRSISRSLCMSKDSARNSPYLRLNSLQKPLDESRRDIDNQRSSHPQEYTEKLEHQPTCISCFEADMDPKSPLMRLRSSPADISYFQLQRALTRSLAHSACQGLTSRAPPDLPSTFPTHNPAANNDDCSVSTTSYNYDTPAAPLVEDDLDFYEIGGLPSTRRAPLRGTGPSNPPCAGRPSRSPVSTDPHAIRRSAARPRDALRPAALPSAPHRPRRLPPPPRLAAGG